MKCAIITCSNKKRKLFSKPYYLSCLTLPHTNEKVFVFNIAYTADAFFLLSSKKKIKLCRKLCIELCKNKIICVYLSGLTNCQEFADIKYKFYIPDGKNVLKSCAQAGACLLSLSMGIALDDAKICIYQKHFDYSGLEILSDFVKHFKNITIIGDFESNLEHYANKLMQLYGASVSTTTNKSCINNCDFAFLLDELDGVGICDRVVVVDLCKSFGSNCFNGAKFEMPQSFNSLIPYFNIFDDVCLEFILRLNDEKIKCEQNIYEAISNLCGSFKCFLNISKNNA